LLAVGIFCLKFSSADFDSGRAIQIVAPMNHSFHWQTDELKPILENDNIRDRHVVVVSIAGAFRQGKSFLLNFFLKYLYAQYKRHDVTDWIGETSNDTKLSGFEWRGGRKRETVGIWMWSEIFTHDFENGDKVAIILLDTQGIFDDQSSVRDCTTIFALNMMLSSIQCYNVMQNIKKDDLQHLQLFTEYGRLALEQSKKKPFQKLLFIVRDWPFAYEMDYGWNGQKIIDESLDEHDDHTPEMRQLRERIQSSFEKITAFLLPSPGMAVARGNDFTGDVQQIDPEFIKYVKVLVPGLFAPENLVVKTINGQKMRARDLVQFLQAYTTAFNGDELPEPKSVLMATAEVANMILFKDCLKFYLDSMHDALKGAIFFTEEKLVEIHKQFQNATIAKFLQNPRLGDDELISSFQQKVEEATEENFAFLKSENERKCNTFIKKSDLHNAKLSLELLKRVKQNTIEAADSHDVDTMHSHLNNVFNLEKQNALDEFNSTKMGDDEISKKFRDDLHQNFKEFQLKITQTLELLSQQSKEYNDKMQESLNRAEYFGLGGLMRLHQKTRNETISQFQSQPGDDELKQKLQPKIEKCIDCKIDDFEKRNEEKYQHFSTKANAHSETVSREIKATFENNLRKVIGNTYRNDSDLINLFLNAKQKSLKEFASRKMGEDALSNQVYQKCRERVEPELDGVQLSIIQMNEVNKPTPPPAPRKKKGYFKKFVRKIMKIIDALTTDEDEKVENKN